MRRDDDEHGAPDTVLDAARTVVDAEPAKTIVVSDRAPVRGVPPTVFVPDDGPVPVPAPAPRRVARWWLAAVAIVGAIAASCVFAALMLVIARIESTETAYESCEGDPPVSVVIAELRQGSPLPTRDDLVSRLAALPPASVTVHRIAGPAGRSVTLEISRSSWPEWDRASQDASGEDVCRRVGQAVGALGARALAFHASRPRQTIEEPVRSFAPVDASYPAIVDWLAPLEVDAHCTFQQRRRDLGTLTVACDVRNPRDVGAHVRISPVRYTAGAAHPLHHDERMIGARERLSLRYEIDARPADMTGECGCEVMTIR